MTVCIAAICNFTDRQRGPVILTASDSLMSGTLGKAENRLKNRPMACGWGIMTAGEDGEMTALVDHVRSQFLNQEWNKIEVGAAMGFVRAAVGARKREKIEELTMSKYGITYDELRKTGNTEFPPDVYREAMWAVENCKLEAEIIVYGFDAQGGPVIITAAASGHIYKRTDFGIVGAGGYLAQSMLLHRGYNTYIPLAEAVYLVYEAKKHAEGETSVGPTTTMFAAERDGRRLSFSATGHAWACIAYEEHKPRPLDFSELKYPDDAFELMYDVSKPER